MILLFLASIRKWDFMQHSSIMGSVTESNIILGTGKRTQNTAQKTHTLSNRCNGNVQVYMFELLNVLVHLFSNYFSTWDVKCICTMFPLDMFVLLVCFPLVGDYRLTAEDSAGHSKCPLPLTLPVIYCGFEGTSSLT